MQAAGFMLEIAHREASHAYLLIQSRSERMGEPMMQVHRLGLFVGAEFSIRLRAPHGPDASLPIRLVVLIHKRFG
jgi:hypothetical protein